MDAMAFTVRGEGTDTLEIDVYDQISDGWMGVGAKAVRAAIKGSNAKTIQVRINSGGGDVFQAYDIYGQLTSHPATVEVSINGLAASAASVIAMAGDTISMGANAWMMVHDPAGGLMGSAQDLRDWANVLDKIRTQIADTYAARGTLDQAKALELMAAETWMTAKEAKSYGLIDTIIPLKKGNAKASAQAFASLSTRGFQSMPDGLRRSIQDARAPSAQLQIPEPLEPVEEPAVEDAAVPYKSYKLDKAGSWDGAAAEGRIRKWASSDGSGSESTIDWAKYRSAFTWYDTKNAKTFGAYKLPHHDVQNGALVTVRSGVIAAGNAVSGSRGGTSIPAGDLPAVKSHLAKHYREFQMRAPWETTNEKGSPMNEEELKQQHPELYAAILKKGADAGVKDERDRVTAHLTLGEQSGDMKTALAAIASGEGMTQTITAKYLAAGMNRSAVQTRQSESDAAAAAVNGAAAAATATTGAPVKDLGDQVAERMAAARGKKLAATA